MVRAQLTKSPRDPSQRVVITGMGICSVFGNDVDTFYDSYAPLPLSSVLFALRSFAADPPPPTPPSTIKHQCRLLAGTSGMKQIDRFDTEGFPTTFAAQITDFDCEG